MNSILGHIYFTADDRLSASELKTLLEITEKLHAFDSMLVSNDLWKDERYRKVVAFILKRDRPYQFINDIISPVISSHSYYIETKDEEHKTFSVLQFSANNCIYEMNGAFYQGKYDPLNDEKRITYPDFDEYCKKTERDTIIYKAEDNNLFVRIFGPANTVFSIDGYIENDTRNSNDKVYCIFENCEYWEK